MKNRALAVAAAAAMGLFTSLGAQASCYQSELVVERVLSYDTYSYIYLRPESSLTNNNYYYVRTTSQMQVSLAAAAQANRTKVNALGDAATCPTTGTARYMGGMTYLYLLN